jgi:hypothetical protein
MTEKQRLALIALYNALAQWPADEFEGRSGRQEYTTAYTVARARKSLKALKKAQAAFPELVAEVCPACEGDGEIATGPHGFNKCEKCGGSGKAKP